MEYECPICQCAAISNPVGGRDILDIECLRCRKYIITGTAAAMLDGKSISMDDRLLLSMWMFENQGVELDSEHIKNFPIVDMPSLHERACNLIREFARRNPSMGDEVELDFVSKHIEPTATRISRDEYANLNPKDQEKVKALFEWMSISRCKNSSELIFLLVDYMTDDLGWLKDWTVTGVTISPSGWINLEEQK